MCNSPNHACSISKGARRIFPLQRAPPVVSLYPRSHPARRPPSNDPRSKLFSLFALLGSVTLGIRFSSPCDRWGNRQGCPFSPLPLPPRPTHPAIPPPLPAAPPTPPRVGARALPSPPGGLAAWPLYSLAHAPQQSAMTSHAPNSSHSASCPFSNRQGCPPPWELESSPINEQKSTHDFRSNFSASEGLAIY